MFTLGFIYATQFVQAQRHDTNVNNSSDGGTMYGSPGSMAAENLEGKTFQELATDFITKVSEYVLQLLLALTVFMFLYGLMKYMFKGQGSDTARTEGRKLMLWGIIGIFVFTSVWSLVALFTNTIGHSDVVIPQFK
jgi:hypothetical protein